MKKWEIQNSLQIKDSRFKIDDLIRVLLKNRGITKKKDIEEFLNPRLENVTIGSVAIDIQNLQKAIRRIKKAIDQKEQIVVFGDYDVDGIAGTTILWETLYGLGAKVLPYIPHRVDEGYGLSIKGIDHARGEEKLKSEIKLIITVDNGIVATKAVEYADSLGIDVIITDHHVQSEKLPQAYAVIHTTKLCGTAIGYALAKTLKRLALEKLTKLDTFQFASFEKEKDTHLELVALATIADLVPLTAASRVLTKFGLEKLRVSKRVGIKELCKEAAIAVENLGVYEIGHIIAPRLNAMGRLEHALDSVRLLCTTNLKRAEELAMKLGGTNRERQQLTMETALHAVSRIKNQQSRIKKLLFIADETYQQGVIGLIAGRLVEEFYRPSIVISIGKIHSKASARSISGFNIIEFIRSSSKHLVDAGGHPMAAGFTVETAKLNVIQEMMEKMAHELIDEEMLTRKLKIDLEIPLSLVTFNFFNALEQLSPFGMGNSEPIFATRNVRIEDARLIGKDRRHVKFRFSHDANELDGVGFGMAEHFTGLKVGDKIDIAYSVVKDEWNGNRRLQLKLRDIKT